MLLKKVRKSSIVMAIILSMSLSVGCNNTHAATEVPVQKEQSNSDQGENNPVETVATGDRQLIEVSYKTADLNDSFELTNMINLSGSTINFNGNGATVSGNSITINSAGTYVISGTLEDGQIIVEADKADKVQLVLNGASIHSKTSAPIYVKSADKVIVTLAEGTTNKLSDSANYVYEDSASDEPNATLFSKDDLTINGKGTLEITSVFKDGIRSKDDLKIVDGTFVIDAADHGIVGKDMVAIKSGDFTIKANGDAIKSTNDTDAAKGFVSLEGGNFNLIASQDGIQAETAVQILDGTFDITSGGGSSNASKKVNGQIMGGQMPGGQKPSRNQEVSQVVDTSDTQATITTEESTSSKGIKAKTDLTITGGSFTIDAADDAVHSNGNVYILDGALQIATGDDGIHADSTLQVEGGDINITKSYEGLESSAINILNGTIHVVSSDDGINVAGDTGTAMDSVLTIADGYIVVDAGGDGLDANGSIVMTGGTVLVNGPENGGNGALDYDRTFDISGGTLVAVGSSAMAQGISTSSSQNAIMMTYSTTQPAGTMLHLEDSKGNNILSFSPTKSYSSVVMSTPQIEQNQSYKLYTGGSVSGNTQDGISVDETYTGGNLVVEFETGDVQTYLTESGVTTGTSNRGGNKGMQRPSGLEGGSGTMEKPTGDRPHKEGMIPPTTDGIAPANEKETPKSTTP